MEWDSLETIAMNLSKRSFRIWLAYEIRQFAKKIDTTTVCIPCNNADPVIKKIRNFDVPYQVYRQIECLANRFDIANSTLIQRFIIDKYLSAHYEEKGFIFSETTPSPAEVAVLPAFPAEQAPGQEPPEVMA